jgi:tRNA(Glu) U13 pseudouridine synthase TruD
MKPCRQCNSKTKGYYTEKSRTCRKCTSQKLMEAQKSDAERKGFSNYYQMQKFKEFNKATR